MKLQCNRKISVFNAGVSSSDPFFEYALLKEKLLKYNPDFVLLSLGSSDLDFYRFRGGFERFTPEGLCYRKAPKWEKLYAVSFITRLIINKVFNYKYFLSPSEYKKDSILALDDTEKCISEFQKLAIQNDFSLIIVFIDDGRLGYKSIISKLKEQKILPVIDLFDYSKNVEHIDEKSRRTYYWPVDEHCNSMGYAMFARGIEWNFKNMGIMDHLLKEPINNDIYNNVNKVNNSNKIIPQ